MKTRSILAFALAAAAAFAFSGCETTSSSPAQQKFAATAKADAAKFKADIAKFNAGAVKDINSPAGQKLLGDVALATAATTVQAMTGQTGGAVASGVGGLITAVSDATKLPTVTDAQAQQAIASTQAASTVTQNLAPAVAEIYTAARAKGAPAKSTLLAITSGLQQATATVATPPATVAVAP